jgi:hypothetical protein
MLTLTLTEFETNTPDEQVYVSLDVAVEAAPFAGATHCTVLERNMIGFLDELGRLGRTSKGQADLTGGWGEVEYVRMSVCPHGSRGNLALRVMLRDPDNNFHVEGSLVVEPQMVIDFALRLRAAVLSRKLTKIELAA